jgi:hypothetical protein
MEDYNKPARLASWRNFKSAEEKPSFRSLQTPGTDFGVVGGFRLSRPSAGGNFQRKDR